MNSIDKFINNLTKKKLPFAMWHLTNRGELQLHKIDFDKGKTWKWQIGYNINYNSLTNIKAKLPKYLLNYDIAWDDFLNYSGFVFLTYGYSDEIDGEKKPITIDYQKPFRTTAFIEPTENNIKDEVSQILHNEYVKEVKLYNKIRTSVLEELKRINPTRASKIKLEINNKPKEISYLLDINDVTRIFRQLQ